MASHTTIDARPTLAKPLAPEDVAVGDYVAVLDVEVEYPAVVWYFDRPLDGQEQIIRVRLRPCRSQEPLHVLDVCLPFVFVQTIKKEHRTLDLRCSRLARLDRGYAERVSQMLRKKKTSKRKRSRK